MLRCERPLRDDPEVEEGKCECEPWKLQLSIMAGQQCEILDLGTKQTASGREFTQSSHMPSEKI